MAEELRVPLYDDPTDGVGEAGLDCLRRLLGELSADKGWVVTAYKVNEDSLAVELSKPWGFDSEDEDEENDGPGALGFPQGP